MQYDFDLVGKIGSMALIRREDADIDYNIFSRLGSELKPGMIWVTSGAAEIGRLDYIKRTGHELMTQDELATMDGGKCILQIRGVRPFLSNKFDLTKHPNYKYLSDADPANAFDPQAYLTRELHLKDEDTFDTYEIDDDEPEEDIPIDLDVVMY